jgi:hypothetical protein
MSEENVEFVSYVYQNIQNMIILADSKANTVLTIQSLLLSITIGTSVVIDVFQKVKSVDATIALIFYLLLSLLILCSLVGIGFSIFVFKARGCTDNIENRRKGLIYFGHVTNFKNKSDYGEQIKQLNTEKILDEYTSQVFQVANIAKEKMVFVNRAITCLIINVFLTILILVFTGYISVH